MLYFYKGIVYTASWRQLDEDLTIDEAGNRYPEITITWIPPQ